MSQDDLAQLCTLWPESDQKSTRLGMSDLGALVDPIVYKLR